jgi:hypothetical protein
MVTCLGLLFHVTVKSVKQYAIFIQPMSEKFLVFLTPLLDPVQSLNIVLLPTR